MQYFYKANKCMRYSILLIILGVVFNRRGLRLILALRIVLPVIAETLLNRTDKNSGAWLLIVLYTMPTVSCCIIS